jgi:xylulokinase
MRCAETANAAAYGAAMLGGLAAGVFPDADSVPFLRVISNRTAPRSDNVKVYGQYYTVYQELYPQLKPLMHKLKRFQ